MGNKWFVCSNPEKFSWQQFRDQETTTVYFAKFQHTLSKKSLCRLDRRSVSISWLEWGQVTRKRQFSCRVDFTYHFNGKESSRAPKHFMAAKALSRISKELAAAKDAPLAFASIQPQSDMVWHVVIDGPAGSPYEEGKFKVFFTRTRRRDHYRSFRCKFSSQRTTHSSLLKSTSSPRSITPTWAWRTMEPSALILSASEMNGISQKAEEKETKKIDQRRPL